MLWAMNIIGACLISASNRDFAPPFHCPIATHPANLSQTAEYLEWSVVSTASSSPNRIQSKGCERSPAPARLVARQAKNCIRNPVHQSKYLVIPRPSHEQIQFQLKACEVGEWPRDLIYALVCGTEMRTGLFACSIPSCQSNSSGTLMFVVEVS